MRTETQLNWLETPNYRRSDPATSKDAGEAITRLGKRKRDQATLLAVIEANPGLTSMEVADLLIRERNLPWWRAFSVASRRLPDLAAKYLVIPGKVRVCTVTGRNARTWRAA